MHNPKILILDEATSGLDPVIKEEFFELLKEEKNKGTTIFFSSHNLEEIKKICDRVAIIKEGNLIKIAKVADLTNTNFINVTICSDTIKELKKEITGKIIMESEDELKIIYSNSINTLLKQLSKYKINKLLIEEPSIEEIVIHYYK